MALNLIKVLFLFKACTTGGIGLLINSFEPYLPVALLKVFKYGKFASTAQDRFLEKLEVPKRWFKHFYVLAGPLSTLTLVIFVNRYFMNQPLPNFVVNTLEFCLNKPIPFNVPAENVLLGLIIFMIHCWKRFYETHFISIFSDTYMNFSIYLVGLSHYVGTIISIIGETHNISNNKSIQLDWSRLTVIDYMFASIFLLASYVQLRTNKILASLRKDKNGKVVTKKHKIPHGGLFEFISAPLQLTEMILYICLLVILRGASTYCYIAFWVIVNQLECAYMSHKWSIETFKDYPKNRYTVIPYIY
ncbi:hypothetical protein TKK_0018185 [Trichogramma kaykai]|uniref:Polyprenal reductase n=1 Tax=Trichogramma kaykai TaxID=54128 RepID=A0ABD2W0M8_9HYME